MTIIIAIVVAYVIGILPAEYCFRYQGYGRPAYGLIIAYFAKGVCAVLFAWMYAGMVVAYFCAVIVVIAHMYPFYSPYSRPGLAVSAGALLVFSPILFLIAISVYLISFLIFRRAQISLILAILSLLIFAVILPAGIAVWFICILLGCFVCTRPFVKGWNCK